MSARTRAADHYQRQRAVAVAGVVAARRQVRAHRDDAVGLARVIANYQLASATISTRTMAAEAGRAPYTDPLAFAGRTAAGVLLTVPTRTLLDDLATKFEGSLDTITDEMLGRIDRMVASEVTDAGRQAASVEIVAEPAWTNYVRVLNPPSCARCAILAGRIYRDNEGFLRHPLCDCEHWPVSSWEEAHDLGLIFSPDEAFKRGQIGNYVTLADGSQRFRPGLSAADSKAIEDGAKISTVVNAAQDMQTASIFGRDGIKLTLAGTTRHAEWRQLNPNRPVRLRPESIYELAKDREDEIRLLKLYGYIKADADVPTDNGRAGGSGGGGNPPAPPSPSSSGSSGGSGGGAGAPPAPVPAPEPDPSDKDAFRAFWQARQEATGLDFKGDLAKPAEVRFVERFQARGERIEWIHNDPSTSTSDFTWRGRDFELKSTKAKFSTIRGRILDASTKALLNHGVTKDRYVIDIGEERLTAELRAQLETYNVGREKYRIAELWVLSESGDRLEQIALQT